MQTDHFPQTVRIDDSGEALIIIDQTKLPHSLELLTLRDPEEVYEAIRTMQVRGAPAIGVTAAYGLYLAALAAAGLDYRSFSDYVRTASQRLNSARPTAVNLSWALRRMESVLRMNPSGSVEELILLLRREADRIHAEDIEVCKQIGRNGLTLLKSGWGILTHCNAGRLAAVEYGTATAPIYVGQEQGYDFRVYCDETRPLLQGMRLTAFELVQSGIDTTIICDNMMPTVMRNGLVQAVLVGCDRVAANGDTANKIGTSGVAIVARHYGVPFYVCAPTSTIDMQCKTGADIPIEERDKAEVTEMWYRTEMSPKGAEVLNPSFDVTDAANISAIITEKGIAYPPFADSLRDIVDSTAGRERATS